MKTKQLIILIILLIIIVCLSIVLVIYTENKNKVNLPNANLVDNNPENNDPINNNDFNLPNLDKNLEQIEGYCGDDICKIGEDLSCPDDCNTPPSDISNSQNPKNSDYCGDGKCSKTEAELGNCDSDCK